MTKHYKLYCKTWDIIPGDYIESDIGGGEATQIHHILYKSQGGKDVPENLIALTFAQHEGSHFRGDTDNWLKREYLQSVINKKLRTF